MKSESQSGAALSQGLDPRALNDALAQTGVRDAAVTVLEEIDSTNSWLMSQREGDSIHGTIVFAERQSAGRGRRGNPWQMRAFDDLVLSVGYTVPAERRLEGLSLAVGVTLCEALLKFGLDDVALKWPNDLIGRDKKLAGILVETLSRPDRGFDVVTGVGLNYSSTDEDARVGALDLMAAPGARQELAQVLCTSVFAALDRFANDGFSVFHDRYSSYDFLFGKPVVAQAQRSGEASTSGIARGVSKLGALLIETEDASIVEVNAGNVTLEGQYQQLQEQHGNGVAEN